MFKIGLQCAVWTVFRETLLYISKWQVSSLWLSFVLGVLRSISLRNTLVHRSLSSSLPLSTLSLRRYLLRWFDWLSERKVSKWPYAFSFPFRFTDIAKQESVLFIGNYCTATKSALLFGHYQRIKQEKYILKAWVSYSYCSETVRLASC